jgi:hypothetical protein
MPSTAKSSEYNTYLPLVIKIITGIFLLYLISLTVISVISLRKTSPVFISKPTSTMDQLVIASNRLPLSEVDKGLSWSIINWLFVEDYNYRLGQKKMIINWGNNLQMYFDDLSNDLVIEITTIPLMKKQKIIQKNIPQQRWICLIIALDNRQLDLFMDGQLIQSVQLEYVPFYIQEELNLFEGGGFRGKCGYLQYLSYRIPQFGIEHFQQIGKKLNNSSILYQFYNSYMFAIVFGFKSFVQNFIILIDRNFKRLNTITVGLLIGIIKWLKKLLAKILELTNKLIFR